jgi:hypothetical protein
MSQLQQRTMQEFRERGYIVGSVERRKRFPARGKPRCRACGAVPMVDISSDLWNCFDLIACAPMSNIFLIQVTSASNHAARRNKILASPEAKFFVMSQSGTICIQSWQKKNNRWQSRDEFITLDQFPRSLPETVEQFYDEQRIKKLPLFQADAQNSEAAF